jgi:hypothetical protein
MKRTCVLRSFIIGKFQNYGISDQIKGAKWAEDVIHAGEIKILTKYSRKYLKGNNRPDP